MVPVSVTLHTCGAVDVGRGTVEDVTARLAILWASVIVRHLAFRATYLI